jgi:hypothetical protein
MGVGLTRNRSVWLPPHAQLGINGLDAGIEAVGFHYPKTLAHKIEMAIKVETDPSDILNEIIMAVRKVAPLSIPSKQITICFADVTTFLESPSEWGSLGDALEGRPDWSCGRLRSIHQPFQHWCFHVSVQLFVGTCAFR